MILIKDINVFGWQFRKGITISINGSKLELFTPFASPEQSVMDLSCYVIGKTNIECMEELVRLNN